MIKTIWISAELEKVSSEYVEGWSCHSLPTAYAERLLKGEIPTSWDCPVLPDRAKFRDFASNSAMWVHINRHTPILASNLYTALLASSQLNEVTTLSEIKTWMTLIAQTLPDGQKLDQVQSPSTLEVPGATLGEPPTVKPIGTFADELDHWLEQSYFNWLYADLVIT